MAYSREMLNEDEEVIFDRHPHWSYMLGSAGMLILALIAFIVIAIVSITWAWIGLLLILIVLLGSVGRFLRWQTTVFVLTTSRIVVRQGILSKSGIEIPLDRVMNISYHQTLFERILKTGNLVIESAGEDGRQLLTDVARPEQVQNLIYKTAEHDEQNSFRGSNTPPDGLGNRTHNAGGRRLTIPEQIEKLAELHREGTLSDDEFRVAKRNLLDRM